MNSLVDLLHHPLVRTLGWALLHSLWQGALLMLLLGVGLFALRRHSANTRYLLSCATLVAMVVCPLLTVIVPRPGTPVPYSVYTPDDTPYSIGYTIDVNGEMLLVDIGSETLPQKLEPLFPMIVAFWLVGVCILTTRLLMGCLLVRRLAREHRTRRLDAFRYVAASLALRMGMTHIPLLLESARVEVPTVFGWLRAVILIPPSALTGLSPQALEALLAHELAHIRRHDYLVNLIQTILETLLFYHPATWWVSARIRIEREHCCDDLAVRALGDQALYIHALATMESLRSTPPTTALAGNGGSLIVRVRRLLDLPYSNPHPMPQGGMALLALSTLCGMVTLGQYAPPRLSEPAETNMRMEESSVERHFSLFHVPAPVESRPAMTWKAMALTSNSFLIQGPKGTVIASVPKVNRIERWPSHTTIPEPDPVPDIWNEASGYGVPRFSPPEPAADTRRRNVRKEWEDKAEIEESDDSTDERKIILTSGPDKKMIVSPAVLQNKWNPPNAPSFSLQKPVQVNINFNNDVMFQENIRWQVETGVRGIESAVRELQVNIDRTRREADHRKDRGENFTEGYEQGMRSMEQALKQMQKELEKARRKADQEVERIQKQVQHDKEEAEREKERARHERERKQQERQERQEKQEREDEKYRGMKPEKMFFKQPNPEWDKWSTLR